MSAYRTAAKFIGGSAAALLILGQLAAAAQASFPPKRTHMSREKVAESCQKLGDRGRGIGLEATSGNYGCENLDTGSTLLCQESGECKFYYYDPRTKWFKKDPENPNKIIIIPQALEV